MGMGWVIWGTRARRVARDQDGQTPRGFPDGSWVLYYTRSLLPRLVKLSRAVGRRGSGRRFEEWNGLGFHGTMEGVADVTAAAHNASSGWDERDGPMGPNCGVREEILNILSQGVCARGEEKLLLLMGELHSHTRRAASCDWLGRRQNKMEKARKRRMNWPGGGGKGASKS